MERTTRQKIIQESVWNEVYDNVRGELTRSWFFNLSQLRPVCGEVLRWGTLSRIRQEVLDTVSPIKDQSKSQIKVYGKGYKYEKQRGQRASH